MLLNCVGALQLFHLFCLFFFFFFFFFFFLGGVGVGVGVQMGGKAVAPLLIHCYRAKNSWVGGRRAVTASRSGTLFLGVLSACGLSI